SRAVPPADGQAGRGLDGGERADGGRVGPGPADGERAERTRSAHYLADSGLARAGADNAKSG
ncbi:MAG TPA: hypothetical protein VIV12_10005, partial [Streptosporangiaceae bacterium]